MAEITSQLKRIAVIMAGGMGSRLWPRSTEKTPKQLIHLIGDGTMIQNTVFRLLPIFKAEDIYIVTAANFCETLYDQLTLIPKENIIPEPFSKNTAPCLALTLTYLNERLSDDTIMIAFPSDHVISNLREFHHSVDVASQLAYDKSGIVTIGITPTRPETSFGYIQINDETRDLNELYDEGVRYTRTFAEKPDIDTAKRFTDSGDFLWNSGIFISRIDTFWKAFQKYLPEQDKLFNLLKKLVGKDLFDDAVEDVYRQMQSVSLDYAILEKANNVFVIESSFSWSDLGNWDELYRLSMKDGRNNVIEGDVIAIDTNKCFISAHEKFIGVIGVDNLIVIDSDDALLICKRGSSDNTMELVENLRRKHVNRLL